MNAELRTLSSARSATWAHRGLPGALRVSAPPREQPRCACSWLRHLTRTLVAYPRRRWILSTRARTSRPAVSVPTKS